MPININRVCLVGNLTRDPDIKVVGDDFTIAEFSVAVNGREKIDGTWQDYASFFDVKCFGATAEAVGAHLTKGSPVAVDGKLKQERWVKDDQKRSRIRVLADNVQFLPSSRGHDTQEAEPDWRDAVPVDEAPIQMSGHRLNDGSESYPIVHLGEGRPPDYERVVRGLTDDELEDEIFQKRGDPGYKLALLAEAERRAKGDH